jgi:hypothetical protein
VVDIHCLLPCDVVFGFEPDLLHAKLP